MKLVADESVEGQVVSALRDAGYSVHFIAETSPAIADNEVLAIAYREQALLITADKDFGDLVYRQRRPHSGVLLMRVSENQAENAAVTLAAIQQHGTQMLHRFSVLSDGMLRIRNDTPWLQ